VSDWATVYPLVIGVSIPGDGQIHAGESAVLRATVELSDTFTLATPYISVNPQDKVEAKFRLFAPGFEVSPSSAVSLVTVLDFQQRAEEEWVIAPNTSAEGTQVLMLEFSIGDRGYTREIVIDVRTLLGMKASTFNALTTLGGVLFFCVTFSFTLLQIVSKVRDLTKTEGLDSRKSGQEEGDYADKAS
jgi:hypothetical protein